jgi:hypothetical protein
MMFPWSWAAFCSCLALLMCGPGGTAIAQTAPSSANTLHSLPSVSVEAPKPVSRHQHLRYRAAAGGTVSHRTSPAIQTSSAEPTSITAKLAKLASATGSCVGGCVTSFRSGDAPWHGCSVSSWPAVSPTCRNTGNFKTYAECSEAGMLLGWQSRELTWYCSSLALK